MSFETLTPLQKQVADSSLSFCKSRFGRNGLKVEAPIHANISWRPTFQIRPNSSLILAVEASESLYPQVLRGAAFDILKHPFPISIMIACPLDAFTRDPNHRTVKEIKNAGFGIITVNDAGEAALQVPCNPIAQHISEEKLENEIKGLSPKLKVHFKSAHATFQTNVGQGLQEAGQIVEAMIVGLAIESAKMQFVGNGIRRKNPSSIIDELFKLEDTANRVKDFVQHRAALGGARDFAHEFRNVVSHPSKNATQAISKINKCREGFISSIRIVKNLQNVAQAKGMKLKIHLT
jgi:hypothetical protein